MYQGENTAMSLLGIDVGTTGCKVIAFREDGTLLAQAYGEYPLTHPHPGWSELDANIVWENIATGIQQVTAQTKSDPIEAISVASQGEAVTPVSATGQILANAITTFDARTAGICDRTKATHNAARSDANHRNADQRYSYPSKTDLDTTESARYLSASIEIPRL